MTGKAKITKQARNVMARVRDFKKWDEKHCLIWWKTVHSEFRKAPCDVINEKGGYNKLMHYLLNTSKPIWSPLIGDLHEGKMVVDGCGKPKELLQMTMPVAPIIKAVEPADLA